MHRQNERVIDLSMLPTDRRERLAARIRVEECDMYKTDEHLEDQEARRVVLIFAFLAVCVLGGVAAILFL